jgi:TonB family protein
MMKADFLERRLEIRNRGLALLISLLVHVGILYLLATHFVSVRIIEFKEPVTPVVIVPPPPLELPKRARDPANLPAVIEGFPEFLPSRTLPGEAAAQAGEFPAAEESLERGAVEAFEPKFSEGFRLDQTPSEKPGITSGDRLRLPIPDRKKGGADVLAKTPAPPKDVDWRKYLSGSSTGGRWAYRSSTVGGKRVRGDLRGRMTTSASVKRYNLASWASKVVEVIQKNWDIPPTRPTNPDAAVEIVIVLQKSGQVSTMEVIASSEDRAFDQAARFAIELSSPLPPLPDDFPTASLEIAFVFSVQ